MKCNRIRVSFLDCVSEIEGENSLYTDQALVAEHGFEETTVPNQTRFLDLPHVRVLIVLSAMESDRDHIIVLMVGMRSRHHSG